MTRARLASHSLAIAGCLTSASVALAQDRAMPRPTAPYVTAACPFECCNYGEWRFETPAALRQAPRADAPPIGEIAAGTRVRADSGHVRIDPIGLVIADRDYRDPDGAEHFPAGDSILVLDYLGEGFFHVWSRGERRQLALNGVLSTFGDPVGSDSAPPALREVRAPGSTWWAHVTLLPPVRKAPPSVRRGWVHMSAEVDVRGADACGGPG
jgi:hypothetical protein